MIKKCLVGDAASEAMDGVTPELRQEASLREKRHPRDTPCQPLARTNNTQHQASRPSAKKLTQTANESPQATAQSDSPAHPAQPHPSKAYPQD